MTTIASDITVLRLHHVRSWRRRHMRLHCTTTIHVCHPDMFTWFQRYQVDHSVLTFTLCLPSVDQPFRDRDHRLARHHFVDDWLLIDGLGRFCKPECSDRLFECCRIYRANNRRLRVSAEGVLQDSRQLRVPIIRLFSLAELVDY